VIGKSRTRTALVMIGVMTMTPVYIRGAGHEAAHTLRIVGVVLSFHIAGMFALSPVFGWLTDRLGRRPVIVAGIALLLTACALAGSAGHHPARLAGGLMVLGLGWSATMVVGSTLLSESVSGELRASAQGLSDLTMGLAGASAGAISGVIVEAWGYPTLTLLAALATAPLIVLVSCSTVVSMIAPVQGKCRVGNEVSDRVCLAPVNSRPLRRRLQRCDRSLRSSAIDRLGSAKSLPRGSTGQFLQGHRFSSDL
jgi:MFS family permease